VRMTLKTLIKLTMLTPFFTVIGFPCLAVLLLTEALLQWKYVGSGNKAGLGACIAVLYLYFIFSVDAST